MSNPGKYLAKLYTPGRYFMLGDEAIAFGAIFAGCRFYAGYPITPASEIAETMAVELPKVKGFYVQMEDEIGSISAIIGASWTGLKSMTATSGPGFSLMQENIGYAIMTETPIVVVDVQRSGPSTGQATRGAQGDYMQAMWGTHGDHSLISISPTSVEECFWLTIEAFNFSEEYRTPVILLTDGIIGHLRENISIPHPDEVKIVDRKQPANEDEAKYPFGGSLVPPMPLLGRGYFVHVTGSTHTEDGMREVFSAEVHYRLVKRISKKIEENQEKIWRWEGKFLDDAEILVVSWGCSARPSLGGVIKARKNGIRVGAFIPKTVHPFPRDILRKISEGVRNIIVAELNLGQMIFEVERSVRDDSINIIGLNKIGGEPLTSEEVYRKILEVK